MLSKREEELTDQFIALAREKGYKESTIELLLMLSCCDAMEDNFGSSEEATEKMLEFVKESDTSQECLEKTCKLLGL